MSEHEVTSFPLRVLIVEDEAARATQLRDACLGAIEREVDVEVVGDGGAGSALLAEREFDLVVDDAAGGLAFFHEVAEAHPGVPVIALSNLGTPAIVNELLAEARREDLFGLDDERPMVAFHWHEDLDECVTAIEAMLRATAEVASIPVHAEPPLELSTSETRALQIFARRTGAVEARVTGLGGGLSGAKTVVLDTGDASGMSTSHVVGKLSHVTAIPGGVDGYENAIPYLPAGLGAALAGVVSAGAGDVGAVFYRLADDYRRTWFECLADSPADAAHAVRRLHERFAGRYASDPHERRTVLDMRRSIWSDEEMAEAVAEVPDIAAIEAIEIQTSRGIQHRDLHGLNVLISDENEPLLIDYDNYAPANGALDPVTLELSAIFHRDEGAQAARGGWPSPAQAANWTDLDSYLEGCPYPEAIRACRAWAEDAAASEQEVLATLVGSAIRQFWFDNTDKELAAALVEAGSAKLRGDGA
jgi:hypothetical protein